MTELTCDISLPTMFATVSSDIITWYRIFHWIFSQMQASYITCHLADTFINLQLIRLNRRHTPWSTVGLRALLKGPTAVQILSWPHQGSNHRPCGSKSSSLTTTLQAALLASWYWKSLQSCSTHKNRWIALVIFRHIVYFCMERSIGQSTFSTGAIHFIKVDFERKIYKILFWVFTFLFHGVIYIKYLNVFFFQSSSMGQSQHCLCCRVIVPYYLLFGKVSRDF